MREGNFSFTSQGRATVCITAQLYDRRALDATSALPLNNSLTHLTYLTSTSPRIREILTVDGGLECLVRMLLDFCNSPPPPNNPRNFYGLLPPGQNLNRPAVKPGTWLPFDRAAAHRFSLAFQCVVNVGVRGSESIRSRVVQAGMLLVVGSVLEQWLLSKGFAIVPSATGSGAPREPRAVRHARRQEELERRQREAEARDAAANERVQNPSTDEPAMTTEDDDEDMGNPTRPIASDNSLPPRPSSSLSDLASDQTSSSTTPARSNSPVNPTATARDRSGTIRARTAPSSSPRASTSTPRPSTSRAVGSSRRGSGHRRPRTAGETDADDTEGEEADEESNHLLAPTTSQATIAVVDASQVSDVNIYVGREMGGFDVDGVGVDGLQGDGDLGMGAPPGAPGATTAQATPRPSLVEITPRATVPNLDNEPQSVIDMVTNALDGADGGGGARVILQNLTAGGDDQALLANLQAPRGRNNTASPGDALVRTLIAQSPELRLSSTSSSRSLSLSQQGPFQDEDVLLSLQLLAYLSKYPYVRQAFYETSQPPRDANDDGSKRSPNVFSLVERFTFRPSPSEPNLPRLPSEIQYWAGVIMRNACRKDDSRGGIRQCASMTCGKWETYPREFAKCRRCRKAKYCGKDCQSRAWAEGHRFWCNVREPEDDHSGPAVAGNVPGEASTLGPGGVPHDMIGPPIAAGPRGLQDAATARRVGVQHGLRPGLGHMQPATLRTLPLHVTNAAIVPPTHRHHHHHHHHHPHRSPTTGGTPPGVPIAGPSRLNIRVPLPSNYHPRRPGTPVNDSTANLPGEELITDEVATVISPLPSRTGTMRTNGNPSSPRRPLGYTANAELGSGSSSGVGGSGSGSEDRDTTVMMVSTPTRTREQQPRQQTPNLRSSPMRRNAGSRIEPEDVVMG